MDTVILAAGRGSRPKHIAPPYFKPLLVVDGEPLIRGLVRTAAGFASGRTVVVAAPENALLLCQVLTGLPAVVIVQREPRGPGDALLMALPLVESSEVYILLGDNVVSEEDQRRVTLADVPAVGVVSVPVSEAVRFTYLTPEGVWVEKQPYPGADAAGSGSLPCWVGPLKLDTGRIRAALERRARVVAGARGTAEPPELPVGPLLNDQGVANLVGVSVIDIGVPSAWQAAGRAPKRERTRS